MESQFYLSHDGKDARVFLKGPRPKPKTVKRVSPNNLDLSTIRIINGTDGTEKERKPFTPWHQNTNHDVTPSRNDQTTALEI
ncbi:MAG: hypothetical protein CMO80_23955 [Verrucomicrobiales bacterium]|nr:hypothetical protein [Verrucomicrobiales bacterium]|tara:strand:- start:10932 stop:11177 length:246 start_codon:yes stop_codon:yes gene_type:complete